MQLNCRTKRETLNSEAWAEKGKEGICGQEERGEEEKNYFGLATNLRLCPTCSSLEPPRAHSVPKDGWPTPSAAGQSKDQMPFGSL